MSELEKPSPIDNGVGDNSSNSDEGNIVDPDAGLSEAEKKEVVSFSCLAHSKLCVSPDSNIFVFLFERSGNYCGSWILCLSHGYVPSTLLLV